MAFPASMFGLPTQYMECNGNKVPALVIPKSQYSFKEIDEAIKSYSWNDEDVLLASYPKTGTNFMMQVLIMLLQGHSSYYDFTKGVPMIDLIPCTKIDEIMPPPRVITTHYRLDCLPEAFHGKKTVLVLRNPKDALVSAFYHKKGMLETLASVGATNPMKLPFNDLTFSESLKMATSSQESAYGSYLDYVEVMWKLRDLPNVHIVYFEDMKKDPVREITKLNEFLGTQRSPELIADIAEKTSFKKMKSEMPSSEKLLKTQVLNTQESEEKQLTEKSNFSIFRKGDIGDWKNHFTVAENEEYDNMLLEWQKGKDVPFIYE